jgi:hypothetical protein
MELQGVFRRRPLPHWDVAGATYFVTSCLADSIPARGLSDLRGFRAELDARPRPANLGEDEWEVAKHKLVFARFDWLLDHDAAADWLKTPALAELVKRSFYHFAGERYYLIAYVVMPSHIHWVFRPTVEWSEAAISPGDRRTPRERILHSFKSFTANECNRL